MASGLRRKSFTSTSDVLQTFQVEYETEANKKKTTPEAQVFAFSQQNPRNRGTFRNNNGRFQNRNNYQNRNFNNNFNNNFQRRPNNFNQNFHNNNFQRQPFSQPQYNENQLTYANQQPQVAGQQFSPINQSFASPRQYAANGMKKATND